MTYYRIEANFYEPYYEMKPKACIKTLNINKVPRDQRNVKGTMIAFCFYFKDLSIANQLLLDIKDGSAGLDELEWAYTERLAA